MPRLIGQLVKWKKDNDIYLVVGANTNDVVQIFPLAHWGLWRWIWWKVTRKTVWVQKDDYEIVRE